MKLGSIPWYRTHRLDILLRRLPRYGLLLSPMVYDHYVTFVFGVAFFGECFGRWDLGGVGEGVDDYQFLFIQQ